MTEEETMKAQKEKEKAEAAKVAAMDMPFVAVAEVKKYLTELSGVLSQISVGIEESIKTMDNRLRKGKDHEGDKSNDDQD